MPRFDHDPPAAPGLPQILRMTEDGRLIGSACWHAAADSIDGVVQILDFNIDVAVQRQGHGKRLLATAIELWAKQHRARQVPLRRAWLTLPHKRFVIARAFFISQGFTHVASVHDLLVDEDALVYVRAFN